MNRPKSSRRNERGKVLPGRLHWWWREERLPRALKGNPRLDQLLYWKVRGRKSPDGRKWTAEQRRMIETALWLYELDARISHKYLFGLPAHRLSARQLSSVVSFAPPNPVQASVLKTGGPRKRLAWAWIEYFDKRNSKQAAKLTRAELNGIISAMKFCLKYFVQA